MMQLLLSVNLVALAFAEAEPEADPYAYMIYSGYNGYIGSSGYNGYNGHPGPSFFSWWCYQARCLGPAVLGDTLAWPGLKIPVKK